MSAASFRSIKRGGHDIIVHLPSWIAHISKSSIVQVEFKQVISASVGLFTQPTGALKVSQKATGAQQLSRSGVSAHNQLSQGIE
jgi:hypothetical protein